jgi:tRNA(fMet)-specific endonuclease VapC
MKYLLDSNAVIDYLRGHGPVVARLQAVSPVDVTVSAITVHELERGLAMQGNPVKKCNALAAFLAQMKILPFDADAARVAGQADGALRARGEMIGPLDMLIAGTALAVGAVLVTHNVREFGRVAGLKLEDWW